MTMTLSAARPLLLTTAVGAGLLILILRSRRLRNRLPTALPPAHVISLARFPAARSSCLKRTAEAGLKDVAIFEAVDGRELSPKTLELQGPPGLASSDA